ncbi:unnamed protein product [Lactuca saligna]|uniref:Kinesin motor domain-containing protein n=1 Tax=Lactuca saligna TaxID=75948 RepID=A0AA35YT11_LACSI|nr:unnamed protein product [Lactuca saligna]
MRVMCNFSIAETSASLPSVSSPPLICTASVAGFPSTSDNFSIHAFASSSFCRCNLEHIPSLSIMSMEALVPHHPPCLKIVFLLLLRTCSGKTYTMGTRFKDCYQTGVIPQSMAGLFNKIESLQDQIEFQLHVSFIEVNRDQVSSDMLKMRQQLECLQAELCARGVGSTVEL